MEKAPDKKPAKSTAKKAVQASTKSPQVEKRKPNIATSKTPPHTEVQKTPLEITAKPQQTNEKPPRLEPQDTPKPTKTCSIKSCKRPYRAKSYCRVHYRKWRQGEYGKIRYKKCSELECRHASVLNRHGYCEEHYQKYYVQGVKAAKPATAPKVEKVAENSKDAVAS